MYPCTLYCFGCGTQQTNKKANAPHMRTPASLTTVRSTNEARAKRNDRSKHTPNGRVRGAFMMCLCRSKGVRRPHRPASKSFCSRKRNPKAQNLQRPRWPSRHVGLVGCDSIASVSDEPSAPCRRGRKGGYHRALVSPYAAHSPRCRDLRRC